MTVPAQNVAPQAVAAAGQTVFNFAWRCDDSALVVVFVNNVQDGGFTVFRNPDQTATPGGTITRGAPCVGGEVVTVERLSPQTQTVALTRYGPFPADTITAMVDKFIMLSQEAASILGKTVKAARASLSKWKSLEMPSPENGKMIACVVDPLNPNLFTLGLSTSASIEFMQAYIQQVLSGGGVVQPLSWVFLGDDVNTDYNIAGALLASPDLYAVAIQGALQEPTTSYTIDLTVNPAKIKFTEIVPLNARVVVRSLGYAKGVNIGDNSLVTVAGRTAARTLSARFADWVNVKDWGAKGDGVTNDTVAIMAAINSAPANHPIVVYFPASDNPYLTSGIRLTDPNKQVILAGDGIFSSRIRITAANADGHGISWTSVDNSWGGLRDIAVETTAVLTHVVYVKGPNNAFMFERALINGSDVLAGVKRATNAVYLEGGSQFWGNFVYTTGITGFNFYLKDQTTSSMVTLQGGNADVGTSGLIKVESTGSGGIVTLLGGRYEGVNAKNIIQYATVTEGSLRLHGVYFTNGTPTSVVQLLSGSRPHWFLDTRHQNTPTKIYADVGTPANDIAAVTADFYNPILDPGGRLFSGQSGKYRLWVDINNDVLRIKAGAPASETDGYVVGAQGLRTDLAYGVAPAPTTAAGNTWFVITPNNGVAFALAASDSNPNTAIEITVTVKNTFGVLGAFTFGAQYKTIAAAWVQPANGFNKSITFKYDVSIGKWVEIYRGAADVAN